MLQPLAQTTAPSAWETHLNMTDLHGQDTGYPYSLSMATNTITSPGATPLFDKRLISLLSVMPAQTQRSIQQELEQRITSELYSLLYLRQHYPLLYHGHLHPQLSPQQPFHPYQAQQLPQPPLYHPQQYSQPQSQPQSAPDAYLHHSLSANTAAGTQATSNQSFMPTTDSSTLGCYNYNMLEVDDISSLPGETVASFGHSSSLSGESAANLGYPSPLLSENITSLGHPGPVSNEGVNDYPFIGGDFVTSQGNGHCGGQNYMHALDASRLSLGLAKGTVVCTRSASNPKDQRFACVVSKVLSLVFSLNKMKIPARTGPSHQIQELNDDGNAIPVTAIEPQRQGSTLIDFSISISDLLPQIEDDLEEEFSRWFKSSQNTLNAFTNSSIPLLISHQEQKNNYISDDDMLFGSDDDISFGSDDDMSFGSDTGPQLSLMELMGQPLLDQSGLSPVERTTIPVFDQSEPSPIEQIEPQSFNHGGAVLSESSKTPLLGQCEPSSRVSRPRALRRRDENHTKAAIFLCSTCHRGFSTKSNHRRHVKEAHSVSGKLFICDLCSKDFTQKTSLVRHSETIHTHLKHSCKFCRKLYSRKEKCAKHETTCQKKSK